MKQLSHFAELEKVHGLLKQIDTVYAQTLLQIAKVSGNLHNDENISEKSDHNESREVTVKFAVVLIQQISDLVRVTELKVSQFPSFVASENYLEETLDLYKGKAKHLRSKLKERQLDAYSEERKIIHQQRLRDYLPSSSVDENESEDARSALFEGRSTGKGDSKDSKSIGDQILTQNKNITSSLQQSKQLMTMSVMQTELNIDTLDQQTKDLTQLNDKLIDMESVLLKSRQIVQFIEKQDKQDKRRIYAAIGFLLLCSAWVLWRRVLKAPARLLLWTLLKMFGVVNWVSSIKTSEKSPIVSPSNVAGTMASESASFSVETEYSSYKPVAWGSVSSSMGDTFETYSSALETFESDVNSDENILSTETLSSMGDSIGINETYVHDINHDLPMMTWDGSDITPEVTTVPELVSDSDEDIKQDEVYHDEEPTRNQPEKTSQWQSIQPEDENVLIHDQPEENPVFDHGVGEEEKSKIHEIESGTQVIESEPSSIEYAMGGEEHTYADLAQPDSDMSNEMTGNEETEDPVNENTAFENISFDSKPEAFEGVSGGNNGDHLELEESVIEKAELEESTPEESKHEFHEPIMDDAQEFTEFPESNTNAPVENPEQSHDYEHINEHVEHNEEPHPEHNHEMHLEHNPEVHPETEAVFHGHEENDFIEAESSSAGEVPHFDQGDLKDSVEDSGYMEYARDIHNDDSLPQHDEL